MVEMPDWSFAEEHEYKTALANAKHGTPASIVGEFRSAISVWRYHISQNELRQAHLWLKIADIYENEIVRRLENGNS